MSNQGTDNPTSGGHKIPLIATIYVAIAVAVVLGLFGYAGFVADWPLDGPMRYLGPRVA